jgi:RHS repeat-associated protein
VTRIGEITAKRERNKKFYLNSDATITAEIYAGSIHYQESGTWQEIDNTIIEDKSVPDLPLRNKGNDFQLRFARQFTGKNKLVSLKVQNNVVFFSPADASKSRAEAGTSAAAIIYRDVYPNIDFEYIADNDSLKENIIINKYSGKNSFSFIIQSPQLTPELKGNEVYFVAKDGTEVFIIPAPFMYDQTNEENCNFVVSLEHQSGPHYKLTYTADEAWLTDPDRVYPVVIDPVVWTKQSSAYSQTRDTFADSKSPTSTHKYYAYLKSGKGSGSRGITRSYIMFPTLPEISAANEIVSAELRLWQSWTTSSTVTVNAHQVTNTWDSGTLTWNNQPTYNAKVLDYQLCKDKENWRIWNVTQTVKDWYKSTPNYGFLIKHAVESQPILDFYSSDKSIQSGRPLLVITYRNNSGIEDYLSYTSMDLGRSGGASVNNYNGNLVYTHTDVSLPGNRMPMTISHVYNADQKASQVGYGSGWRLNLSQTLTPETIQGVSYMKYIDCDGTIHHFLVQSNKYYLQTPGLYLELVKNSDNTYTMKDTQNNQLKFSSAGNLIEIKNRLGDKITLGYSNNRITTVTDGAGRVAHLTYNASNILTKITDPAGRAINFTYSGTNLYKVTYPDNAVTVFAYSASKITKVTHPGGQYLQLTYYNDNDVSKISCYGSDGVLGQSYAFNYWVNATTITDRNNKVTTYIFNNDGNPSNIIDSQGNAACLTFEDNLLVNEVPFRGTTINLLRNHNLERSEEWTFSDEGESTATGAYVSGSSFHGSKAIKISKTITSGLSFYRQNQNLTKGQTYTLSAYLKTADIAGTGGAILIARYKDSAGSWVEERSIPVTGTKDWQRLCLTFTFPANSSSTEAQICLALAEATGTVWYDCPQLEKGPAPTSYNLVENSSFELDSDGDGMPDRWLSANLTANDKAVTNQKRFDSRSFRIYGGPTVSKNVSQPMNTSGSKGDTFVVSGWAKARSVPRTVTSRRFALCLGFYSSNPTVWKWLYFNDDYTGWQYLSGIIQAPVDYTSIRVYGIYYQNANEVYFDGFQVNKEPVSTYSYDDKGNIISAKDTNNAQTSFTYNSTNDLIKAVDPKGGNFTYQYNYKRNLVSAQSPAGTCYSFAYDGYGNIVESSLGHLQNPNLVSNGDFSVDTTQWEISCTNNSGTLNHDNALKLISMPSEPNNSISAWQEIDVKANTTYTLSGKIKTQLTEGEAYFRVDTIDNTGSTVQVTTNQFVAVTGSNDWLERVHTFTTDANAAKVRVHLCLTDANSQGSAWFDAIQLEEGSTVSAFNMLSNSDFEQGSSGVPSGFKKVTASGSPVFTLDSSAKQGSKSAKISASSSSVGYLDLDQEVHLKPNTRYTISFWVKGTGLTASTTVATAYCTDSSGQNSTELFKYLSGGTFEWRNVTKTFTTPDTGTYLSNLQLGFVTASSGQVFFDAVTLKEEGIVVKASYTSDYNYLRKIYDIAGNATATYNYTTEGLKTGEVASVTDGAGNIQAYTYDILSRVKEVSDNTSGTSVNYTYNNLDSLQKISRAQFDYVFAYDSLGRMTQVKAGSNTLATHAYDSQTGNLIETTFGNNQVLQYTYDALDRLQGVKYNNSTKHLYNYDARGNIVKVTDNENNVTTYYTYDLADRLLNFRESTGRYVTYEYDENNNATGLREVIDGVAYKTSFQYNQDNTVKSITINSGASFEYFHDEKGLPSRVITTLNPNLVQNPAFAGGLDSWVNVRGMSIESGSGLFGSNAARGLGYSELRQNFTGLEEEIYTLSAYIKVINNPINVGEFTARIYDAANNILAISNVVKDTGGDWVRVTATMQNPGVPAYITLRAGSTSSLYTGEEEVLWDGVQLEQGSTASEFEKKPLYTNYSYNERGLLSSLRHSLESYTYEFDVLGNITKITAGSGDEASYTYDSLNQLKTESITENGVTRTISYAYDSHGNMTSKVEGNKEIVYTYNLDRLIQIEEKTDGITTSIENLTYDDAGNLLTDGEFTYTWQMGRQLQGITGTGLNASYKYNENGLRTQKTVNGQTHEYTLLGSSVTREVIRDEDGDILWNIHYSYAGDSTPVSMNVNGTEYYYLKNAQGDITHIVDEEGNEVASYEYDAWGNILSITGGDIAQLNRYRYRGYRYDSETGLYYLQSRYYNPEWGRFINADDTGILTAQGELMGQNLYAYCTNDPVNFSDDHGYWKMPNWAKVVVGAVALTAAVAITVATGGATAPLLVGVATSTVSGAVIGAITGGKQGAIDGACNGFMWGSIAALGGSVFSAGVKAVKSTKAVRQGVTIGRGMERVTTAADDLGTAIYKPLNENIYNAIGKVSKPLANKISLAHNKVWIEGMKLLKVNIYDIGLGPYTSPGPWYGMELEAVKHYAKHIIVNGF